MLSALLRLIGKDGTNTLSASNPLPVEIQGGAGNWAVDNFLEAGGATINSSVTLTIPAVAGKTIVIGSATAEIFYSVARTASATLLKCTISNLTGTYSKLLPNNATTVGQLDTLPLIFTSPQKASAVGMPVVINIPALAGCVGRLQATYTYV